MLQDVATISDAVIPGWCHRVRAMRGPMTGASTRPQMRNCASGNLEIPGSISDLGFTRVRQTWLSKSATADLDTHRPGMTSRFCGVNSGHGLRHALRMGASTSPFGARIWNANAIALFRQFIWSRSASRSLGLLDRRCSMVGLEISESLSPLPENDSAVSAGILKIMRYESFPSVKDAVASNVVLVPSSNSAGASLIARRSAGYVLPRPTIYSVRV